MSDDVTDRSAGCCFQESLGQEDGDRAARAEGCCDASETVAGRGILWPFERGVSRPPQNVWDWIYVTCAETYREEAEVHVREVENAAALTVLQTAKILDNSIAASEHHVSRHVAKVSSGNSEGF